MLSWSLPPCPKLFDPRDIRNHEKRISDNFVTPQAAQRGSGWLPKRVGSIYVTRARQVELTARRNTRKRARSRRWKATRSAGLRRWGSVTSTSWRRAALRTQSGPGRLMTSGRPSGVRRVRVAGRLPPVRVGSARPGHGPVSGLAAEVTPTARPALPHADVATDGGPARRRSAAHGRAGASESGDPVTAGLSGHVRSAPATVTRHDAPGRRPPALCVSC